MKTKLSILACLMLITMTSAYSQEKSKKELKEEEKLQKQQQIETLINSKDFVFKARYALPMGAKQVDLTTNPNYVKFNPDLMDGYMPFFGTASSGIGFGSDNTIKFKDKPESFNIVKNKKNFQVDAKVKGENDIYRVSLSVSFEGSSSMSIISNNRSTISYQGAIFPSETIKYK
jgi:Domain of unknown function (DUF4251)